LVHDKARRGLSPLSKAPAARFLEFRFR